MRKVRDICSTFHENTSESGNGVRKEFPCYRCAHLNNQMDYGFPYITYKYLTNICLITPDLISNYQKRH